MYGVRRVIHHIVKWRAYSCLLALLAGGDAFHFIDHAAFEDAADEERQETPSRPQSAGGQLSTSIRPTLTRQTESELLYEHSPWSWR